MFTLVIMASLTVASNKVPQFENDVEQSVRNMEIYTVTNQMITEPGRHSFGAGGTNWEKNSSTLANTTEFGLASDYHIVSMDKLDSISTTGQNKFNYSQFRDLREPEHQYFFNFTWMPIVETSKSFIKTHSPSKITEPDTSTYATANNRVHYGSLKVSGTKYRFLVTAHNSVYDTVYVSDDWDFKNSGGIGPGGNLDIGSYTFTVKKIQNRFRKPGTSVILENDLKSFGPRPGNAGTVTKINRFAALDAQGTSRGVVRMEVLAW